MNDESTSIGRIQTELSDLYKELTSNLTPAQRKSVQERIAQLEGRDIEEDT